MRKLSGLLAALALVAAFPAGAAADPTILAGVTVGGVAVGGMTRADAATAVRAAYLGPALTLRINGRTFHWKPSKFAPVISLKTALDGAMAATAPGDFPVTVRFSAAKVRTSAAYAVAATVTPAVDATWKYRGHVPYVVPSKTGLGAKPTRVASAIRAQLRQPALRTAGADVARVVLQPAYTTANVGPAIVINRASNELRLYRLHNHKVQRWRTFRVATGQAAYPTPAGTFQIVVKWRNPWWYPPDSPWAAGKKPIPPGPGNPLGTRWMGLSAPGVGIHGTPDAASIGYSASHGCIRMHIPEAEWLFQRVRIGTPVKIL
jgi:lipoprotein-anchoring transpeptidase ErfK/SrfK